MKDLRNLEPIDYLKVIWRRRWYVLAGFLVVSIGAGVYAWRMPDIYKSESSVVVESALISQGYVRPSVHSSPEEQIAGIRAVLQSRSFLEQIVQDIQLYGYGTDNGFSMDDAVAFLRPNIRVASLSQNMFMITCSAILPQSAQELTKRVVQALIDSNKSSRENKALETDQFLDEQLRKKDKELTDKEEEIKQFKTAHLGELPDQSAANMNAINGLNAQLDAVENSLQNARDRQKQLNFMIEQQKQLMAMSDSFSPSSDLPSSLGSDATKPASSASSLLKEKEADLHNLRLNYTSNHPDVIRLSREVEKLKQLEAEASAANESPEPTPLGVNEEESKSTESKNSDLSVDSLMEAESAQTKIEADSIQSEIAKYQKEKDAILGQIKEYGGRLKMAPALEQEFMALSREHDKLEQQYASLNDQKFQAQMTANLETDINSDTYKIVDEANLPDKPAFPDRLHIILMGLGAGIVVGIGGAFGRELLDTTLGNEDEVAAVLKLPVLVTVSEIEQKHLRKLKSA